MGVTPWWPTEANSGVRGRVHARQKAPEGMTDRQTDTHEDTHTHTHTHTIRPSYDDVNSVCNVGTIGGSRESDPAGSTTEQSQEVRVER